MRDETEKDKRQQEVYLLIQTADDCLQLAASLIPEIETLISCLNSKAPKLTGLPAWIRNLRREEDILQNLLSDLRQMSPGPDEDEQGKKCRHRLEASCTQINHSAQKWSILQRCGSLVAVNQTFHSSTRDSRRTAVSVEGLTGREKSLMHRTLKEKGRIEVDVVDSGAEWIDIRSVSLKKLERELADAGWEWGHARDDVVDREEWEDCVLAKQITKVVEAARRNKFEYSYPRVRIILPRIRMGQNADIDAFLLQLTRIDELVQVIISDSTSPFLSSPAPPLDPAIQNLVGDEQARRLTQTLNLDHTVLVDLISDLTHCKLEPQPWQAETTRAQIKEENAHAGGLMAKTLYPILAGRELVCTREAAEHLHQMLQSVGTEMERRRARILIPFGLGESLKMDDGSGADLSDRLASIHPPPRDVKIPVRVLEEYVDYETAVQTGRLPRVAREVARRWVEERNRSKVSTYMYGWMEGVTTVTSSREVENRMKRWVLEGGEGEDGKGPVIWRVGVTRNLLAKGGRAPEGWEGMVWG